MIQMTTCRGIGATYHTYCTPNFARIMTAGHLQLSIDDPVMHFLRVEYQSSFHGREQLKLCPITSPL